MATTVDPNALSNDELIAIAVTASVGGVALLGLVIGITVWWCCVRPKDEKKRTVKHLYHHRDINGQIVEAPPPNAYNNGSMDNLDDRRYGNGYANGMYLDDRGREMRTGHNSMPSVSGEVEYLYYDGGHPPNGDVPRGAPKMESTSEHLFNNRWYIPRPQVSYR